MAFNLLQKRGLSSQEAASRLLQDGKNILPEKAPPSDLSIFISQLKNPLVYILLISAIITFLIGEYADTSIIVLAVFINTILGFIQERKANRSLDALKKMIHPVAKVYRDGQLVSIDTSEIVVEDLVLLHQGDRVPADGVVDDSTRFFVNEAMLTGESVPVTKSSGAEIYMGTVVVGGNALMKVIRVGAATEMGKIATSVMNYSQDTPLRRQLAKFSKSLTVLVSILVAVVFLIGLVKGKEPFEIFTTSVALAVSAIPEGLLVGLTVVLAIGMQKILKRKGLVRNLVSAETLGGVTTICMDKTGTLTFGTMSVAETIGSNDEIALQAILANDMDDPMVLGAFEWAKGIKHNPNALLEEFTRIDSIPFTSREMYFASLNKLNDQESTLYLNGAPEVLLKKCTIENQTRERILAEIDRLSGEGKRLLGYIRKKVPADIKEIKDEHVEGGFEWIGLLGFSDPVRPDVKVSLQDAERAGIKLIIITGDYAKTSLSVLKQLDLHISDQNLILGDQVAQMSDEELKNRLTSNTDIKLFARTKPDQKLKIVEALKSSGEVVAMMGDGVNDAPALSRSDIGIVVGDATEVAKETSDLVLLDSSFSTIIAAVEEGRGIFDNLRKIILYLLSDGFEEIILVIATLIFGLPLPISAAQILWVNLISDGFPHLALTMDPKVKGIMSRPPRSPKEPLVANWMLLIIGIVSVIGGFFAFALYSFVLNTSGNENLARSVTFATVGINSLVYVFSIRTLRQSFWEENMFENKWLVVAVIGGIFLQVLPFIVPVFGKFLELEDLGLYWIPVIIGSLLMFISIEVSKEIFDRLEASHKELVKKSKNSKFDLKF